jgi:hypothetical protein
MNHRHAFPFLLIIAVISGCSTHPAKQGTQPDALGPPHLLSTTEPRLGRAYELGVYVIQRGDSVPVICKRFQISVRDFMVMNPELAPTRLRIGQQVRIREAVKD